jgi:hypothetical protein
MIRHCIVIKAFEHQIDCFYLDGTNEEVVTIHTGDIIEIINDHKFVLDRGWRFVVP